MIAVDHDRSFELRESPLRRSEHVPNPERDRRVGRIDLERFIRLRCSAKNQRRDENHTYSFHEVKGTFSEDVGKRGMVTSMLLRERFEKGTTR